MILLKRLLTYAKLGLPNLARVGIYRLGIKTALHPVLRLRADVASGPFFGTGERSVPPPPNSAWDDRLWWFGWHNVPMPDSPPDWFANPFSNILQPDATRDWWRIPDFGTGDIKGLWELSRMDWAVAWATAAASGDVAALERLNLWLTDWAESNPPYKGPNWKCGQEVSIRVMHLVTAAWVLGQDLSPKKGLIDLLRAHLQRIAPTMSYAIGQQNNHGTSEAAALFIGGTFMVDFDPRANAWARKGRRWLEERAEKLIATDGSFSQYSVTYHRMMLDTYALVEAWRRHRGLAEFSAKLEQRLAAATNWLWALTDCESGDAPNLGANDGARLLPLVGSDYRDFRPTVQLAASLFLRADPFGPGPWSAPLNWFGVAEGKRCVAPSSQTIGQGGYHVLRKKSGMALLRYPKFRFRPSQADALHVDLWHNGTNLLRDAGTFSYNAEDSFWFSGTAAHNTIEFDDRDQMPRLGRFLFGDWLNAEDVTRVTDDGTTAQAAAGYTDATGARHYRAITLSEEAFDCHDTISGNFEIARLRWRLAPGNWHVQGNAISNGICYILIKIDDEPICPTLSTTIESRYYQNKAAIKEISVSTKRPGKIVTKVIF